MVAHARIQRVRQPGAPSVKPYAKSIGASVVEGGVQRIGSHAQHKGSTWKVERSRATGGLDAAAAARPDARDVAASTLVVQYIVSLY